VSVLVLGLCGCASSERMARMSGGVVQEYSAPSKQRIRSEKFQKHTRKQNKPRTDIVGKVEETPVNIWPFFFGSEYYTSVMWPIVDWDEYGFAVRPFYNQEGDEYSVLFPLTAWNTVDSDGWVLLFSWHKNGWLFFPLASRSETEEELWRYYTPFFIQHKDLRPLSLKTTRRSSFTELLLGYYHHERKLNTDGWSWEALYGNNLTPKLRRYFNHRLAGTKYIVPDDYTDLKHLRKEIAATLPVDEEQAVGFIPFFHVSWDKDGHLWRALAYLIGGESKTDSFGWDVLGPLVMSYEYEDHSRAVWSSWGYGNVRSERNWKSFLLLSYFNEEKRFVGKGKYEIIKELYGYTGLSFEKFRRARPDINAELAKLDPSLELPATVTDGDTLKLHLDELGKSPKFKDMEFPFHTTSEGGFVPLYIYRRSDNPYANNWWISPLALTYRENQKQDWMFWSIPILTFSGHDEESDWLRIFPPLVWNSSTSRRKRIEKPIHAANFEWAPEGSCISVRGDWSLCGLYYHGYMSYSAVKPGLSYRRAEHIRTGLPRLFREKKEAREQKDELEKKYLKEKLYQPIPGDEVDACRKQLKLAELRRDLRKLAEEEKKRDAEYAAMRSDAKSLGFELDEKFPEESEQVDAALERLFDAATEVHSQEDIGSGFFYRKELRHNGDSNWRFCGVLAGGEKRGDREHMHVLQFLYRYRRDGKRMEKIYFPFISIREDENESRVSFMGRIWQRTERNGKSGGYFFFIPYGEP
jgi:hypothetical protein